jgi:hypothetical protein
MTQLDASLNRDGSRLVVNEGLPITYVVKSGALSPCNRNAALNPIEYDLIQGDSSASTGIFTVEKMSFFANSNSSGFTA